MFNLKQLPWCIVAEHPVQYFDIIYVPYNTIFWHIRTTVKKKDNWAPLHQYFWQNEHFLPSESNNRPISEVSQERYSIYYVYLLKSFWNSINIWKLKTGYIEGMVGIYVIYVKKDIKIKLKHWTLNKIKNKFI